MSVSYDQWLEDCKRLPKWRLEKALSYHFLIDKVLCTKAFLLLQDGLRELYGISEGLEFEYLDDGKPVLKNYPNIHFNLSHCKKGVLCVIDDKPVGCDIEAIAERLDVELTNYIFDRQTVQDILRAPNPCLEFTKQWTLLEAVYKFGPAESRTETHTDISNGYVYTIASLDK